MTELERKMLKGAVDSRWNLALRNLKIDPEYMERIHQQEESEKAVDEILHRLDKEDRLTIRHHYEGENARQSLELFATYLQGLRDCMKLMVFLDAFHAEPLRGEV